MLCIKAHVLSVRYEVKVLGASVRCYLLGDKVMCSVIF